MLDLLKFWVRRYVAIDLMVGVSASSLIKRLATERVRVSLLLALFLALARLPAIVSYAVADCFADLQHELLHQLDFFEGRIRRWLRED